MSRVKRGTIKHKKRERLLKKAKGYQWRRKSTYKAAKQALMKAWQYQYRDRRRLKREKRALWQIRIGAASRAHGLSYSKFMAGLKKANIQLDRKILAELAAQEPEVFKKIVEIIQS
ncbi:MAG: 50S ribosomal protein L20 [Candidatus Terrybacteria bacterium RIFCSPHIGHO2_01_FULL_48_17]|uniref:Large ribosomal subunit protein bL20 n=1 Tax=Candidatus Terrybacteria bacterium RIFCSPHIGHO2_01_FULL_48_17 TaxID=1802362 RepID=A0A1G2PMK0_9BACT|nr:MAG: 50S ribosomal protein L20 [Candidatus Terrybacteria bacterium RIFCSPHIGHO2_01_FULL_48_17]OHA53732.1 MAG: 50S ribosomal protein L20 [Candidatus Terrybacteria bacterium RIFCSPLOWO2_01_FULL_48_14]